MSRDFPQESTTPEPVSTSRESLFDSVMQEVIRNPLPVLRIRGTHKSASDPDGEYVDFDLKLAQPEDTIREYLRMDGNSYDPINMNEIQDKVRGLCDRFRTTETEHSIIFRINTSCHFTDEEATRSYVNSLCFTLKYAGTVEVTMENSSAVSSISAPEAQTGIVEKDEVHVIEARWSIHWPFRDDLEHAHQLNPWRQRVGQAIVDGEQGTIALETLRPPSGKSLLRRVMAERDLSVPVSQRTDECGVTWKVSKTLQWGMDEV